MAHTIGLVCALYVHRRTNKLCIPERITNLKKERNKQMKKASSWAVSALLGTLVFLTIAIFAYPHSHTLGNIFAAFGTLSFLSLGLIGVWWLIEDYNEEQRKNEYFNRLNTK